MENGTILSMNFTRGKNKTLEHPEIFMMACSLLTIGFKGHHFANSVIFLLRPDY